MVNQLEETFEPYDKEFFTVFAEAVKKGIALVNQLKSENKYIGSHYNFPSINLSEDGMPNISTYSSSTLDYGSPFSLGKSQFTSIDCNEIPEIRNFIDFAKSKQFIQRHFNEYYDDTPSKIKIFEILILILFTDVVDRFFHSYKDQSFTNELFLSIYKPLEFGLLSDKLIVEILVPILMIGFDFDCLKISDTCSIIKMSEGIQLARAIDSSAEVHSTVANRASHAILFKGYELENTGYSLLHNFSSINSYPLEKIEQFFAALRIVSGYNTGYSQILTHPINWTFTYKAFLPPLYGAINRAYPNYFDKHYWLRETKIITKEQGEQIGAIYKELNLDNNRTRIAIHRLNNCFLRSSNEDRILDSAIGLEALFADDEKQEMTHKLALRVAAISKLDNIFEYTPIEIFDAVKKIYAYRSAVAHGSRNADKKREIEIKGNKISTVDLAVKMLRNSLTVLLKNPKYLNPKMIDEELLLG